MELRNPRCREHAVARRCRNRSTSTCFDVTRRTKTEKEKSGECPRVTLFLKLEVKGEGVG